MKRYFIILSLALVPLFPSGGYDHGTSTGKSLLELDFTWNPFNYFNQGQSYFILGYGITKKIDFHAYYSITDKFNKNYYAGVFYQFIDSKKIDIATAVGIRAFSHSSKTHLFFPQILYTIKLTDDINLGGSIVNIKDSNSIASNEGIASDIFVSKNLYDSDNIKIDFSIGAFSPALWEPNTGNWHATYSFDIKILN